MYYGAITYRRGQVWWRARKDEDTEERLPGVTTRNRPYLIISSDRGNASSPSVLTAKLTTSTKDPKSVNVQFTDDQGYTRTVLCNQIEAVPKQELTEYITTLNDKTMDEVSKALCKALGIEYWRLDKLPLPKTYSDKHNSCVSHSDDETTIITNNGEINYDA